MFFQILANLIDDKVNDMDLSKTGEISITYEMYNTRQSKECFDTVLEAIEEMVNQIDNSYLNFFNDDFNHKVSQWLNGTQQEWLIRLKGCQ